ncbi:SPX and EXS domain-containing protein 3 [Linum perenne]
MFGGQVIPPGNSPHLRKSGSRSVVFDLDGEQGNGTEEGFSPSSESDNLKSLPIQLSAAAAMMPSPVLLWRLKVLLFFLWGFVCCKIGWGSVMRMSVNLRDLFLYEVFLYYNPLLLVVLLYCAVTMILIFPFDIFYLSSRYFLLRTLWRILFPLQAITFADFFLADILTSMSKVFSDLERSVCRMVHRQVATIAWFEADSICGSHSVAIPLVLVLPYLFRLFQCLRQYKDTKEKTSLLNALKYSTAVPVIFLSALKYHVFPERWTNFYRPLWLLSSFVNCMYSFYWDITRDWDLSGFTRIFKFNRPSLCSYLLHGRKWVYFWVIGSNLILRCTWTYKLSAHLRHNYLTVFAITALEIFRRFQWVFFRVENEWNKMSSKSGASQQLVSMNEMSTEDEKLKLLASSDHNV